MHITSENWDEIAALKKKELQRCEICGKDKPAEELCARHLAYDSVLNDSQMIIICKDCNYNMHLAEVYNKERLAAVNDKYYKRMIDLLLAYRNERADDIATSIFIAVGKNRTKRRPSIDMLFKNPNLMDEDKVREDWMMDILKSSVVWDGHLVDEIASKYKRPVPKFWEDLQEIIDGLKERGV